MRLIDSSYGVFDTETTGLSSEDKIIQIAMAWFTPDHQFKDQYETFVDPEGRPIDPAAQQFNHILEEDLLEAPSLTQVMEMIGSRADYYVAHNAPFDLQFLPLEKPTIDTLRLSMKLWPELTCHKNWFLKYHFKFDVPGLTRDMAAHRALPDVLVTAALYRHCIAELRSVAKDPDEITVEKLITWIAKPMLIDICPWKKHRGKTMEEVAKVDKQYLKWALGGIEDLSEDLRYTINYWLEKQ